MFFSAVVLAFEEMRTLYASGRKICIWKFGSVYQGKKLGRDNISKAPLPPGLSNK